MPTTTPIFLDLTGRHPLTREITDVTGPVDVVVLSSEDHAHCRVAVYAATEQSANIAIASASEMLASTHGVDVAIVPAAPFGDEWRAAATWAVGGAS